MWLGLEISNFRITEEAHIFHERVVKYGQTEASQKEARYVQSDQDDLGVDEIFIIKVQPLGLFEGH